MIALETQRPQLYGELENIIRLFFDRETIKKGSDGQARLSVSHACEESCGQALHRYTIREGESIWESHFSYPVGAHAPLEHLRLLRRGAKLGLYRWLQEKHPRQLPWGALTGIRPTKLLRQLTQETGSGQEARRLLEGEMGVSRDKIKLLTEILQSQEDGYRYGCDDEADIYIGIPFCRTRCLYCSFVSADLSLPSAKKLVDPYTEALLLEIEDGGRLLKDWGRRVRSVYIGGGTPSVLGTDGLRRVLSAAQTAFPGALEWTVEAGRPDTMDNHMLPMLRDMGIDRISVNPQTMNDATLRVIGRAHTAREAAERLLEAEVLCFPSVNVDLIMGLPGEGEREAEKTIAALSELPFHNLTVHTLAIKHSSRLHEKLAEYPLPDGETVARMVDMGREAAYARGMTPYYLYRQKYMSGNLENVGYALPGKACLYNIDIMEETHHMLALGAGAISKRMIYSQNRHERFPNPKGVPAYLQEREERQSKRREFFLRQEPMRYELGGELVE